MLFRSLGVDVGGTHTDLVLLDVADGSLAVEKVATTPKNTEAIGLTYQKRNWDVGMFNKRVGTMYNDNGNVNQAVTINPFNVTNLFFNYTVRGASFMRGSKIRFAINNLFDDHSIVGVAPFNKNSAPSPGDVLTLVPARSVSVTMTFGYAPSR